MRKHPILVLLAGLLLLTLFQREAVMPLVYKVIQSDAFLVDTEDTGQLSSITTPLTNQAFVHCNNYVKSRLDADTQVNFPEKPKFSWALGGYQYLINADISIEKANSPATAKQYACRISYKNGSDESGLQDFKNWKIDGLSGLDSD